MSGAQRPRGPKLVMDFRYFTTHFLWAYNCRGWWWKMFFYVYDLNSLYAVPMGKGPTAKTSRSSTGSHVACIEIVCVEISLSI